MRGARGDERGYFVLFVFSFENLAGGSALVLRSVAMETSHNVILRSAATKNLLFPRSAVPGRRSFQSRSFALLRMTVLLWARAHFHPLRASVS